MMREGEVQEEAAMFKSRPFAALALASAAAYTPGAFAENGVSAARILIGQSASLTGTTAEVGRQMRDGALAYLETVNSKGGINGRKIELITLDDAGQTKVGEANTKKLIEENKVFLLFGYTGRNTSEAALPIIGAANIPFFGAATGGESIHGAFNRNVFNVRASYTLETQALVNYLVSTGQTKMGMIYHKDDLKKSNLKMTEDAAAVHKVQLMGSAAVERNSSEVKDAVAVISKLNPDAVICNAAVKPLGEFVRQMRKAGATSQFLSVSFVGSPIVKELGNEAAGLIMAQVVPLPTKVRIPVVAEYQKALANLDPKAEYSFSGLEGFITAKVLVEGLRRTGKDLTRPKFIRAMESIHDLDVGDYFVSYSPTNHNGSKYVDITVINKDGRFFN
jgi:ABC-type branched-subunit amino acid transport system substrate-binding protein